MDLIPGLGISPGGRNGNPLQYSCLENPMDRGAWRSTIHGVTKSRTRLRSRLNNSSNRCMRTDLPCRLGLEDAPSSPHAPCPRPCCKAVTTYFHCSPPGQLETSTWGDGELLGPDFAGLRRPEELDLLTQQWKLLWAPW